MGGGGGEGRANEERSWTKAATLTEKVATNLIRTRAINDKNSCI